MGLLTILKKVKEQEKEIRILLLGLDNAGKTTIIRKLCGQSIDTVEPTLGFQIHTIEHTIENLTYTIHIWDIGGQSTIRAYWRNYFEKTDGIIWVVDSTDTSRISTTCKYELELLLQQERLAGSSLLVFANKQDIIGSLSSTYIAKYLDLINDNDNKNKNRNENQEEETNNNDDNDKDKDKDTSSPPPITTIASTNNDHKDSPSSSSANVANSSIVTTTTTTTAATTTATTTETSSSSISKKKNLLANRHWSIQSCSAVTGDGLVEGIQWLIEDISNRIFLLS